MTSRASTTTSNNDLQGPSQEEDEEEDEEEDDDDENEDEDEDEDENEDVNEDQEGKAPKKISTSSSRKKKSLRQLTNEERAIIQQVHEFPDAYEDEHVLSGIMRLRTRKRWDIALAWLQSQEGIDDVWKYDNDENRQFLRYNTTLESALFYEICTVPSKVIKAISKINPDAAKVPTRRGDGDLLIHEACYYHENKSCVRALIKAYPGSLLERGQYGDLPIHRICHLDIHNHPPLYDVVDLLLDKCPESLTETDKNGRLPLHHAARRVRSIDVITKYIKLYPEAVRQEDDHGWLPLHYCLLYSRFDMDYENGAIVHIAKLLIDSYPESIFVACNVDVRKEGVEQQECDESNEEEDAYENMDLFPKELVRLGGKPGVQKELIKLLDRYEQQYMVDLARDFLKQYYSINKKHVLIRRRSRRACTRKLKKTKYSA